MNSYKSNQDFLIQIVEWGNAMISAGSVEVDRDLEQLMKEAERGVQNGVFSPFLYIVFAANMKKQEQLPFY